MSEHTCPECNGTGESGFVPVFVRAVEGRTPDPEQIFKVLAMCPFCNGKKTVTSEQLFWRKVGQLWRTQRLQMGVGLREWAVSVGCSPADYCNMENGRLEPDPRYAPLTTVLTERSCERLFYLQNVELGYLGNSPMWWCTQGGYTPRLDFARQFTKAEADDITRGTQKFKAWTVAEIEKIAYRTVDVQDMGE